MTHPAQYRVPLTEAPGHVYLSRNSLAWNRATGGQGHTVALGPGIVASYQGHTISLTPPPPVTVDPGTTVVIGTAPPRLITVADVERELARPLRVDPPEYCRTVAAIGWPVVEMPDSPAVAA
jgi:hypothetical protein